MVLLIGVLIRLAPNIHYFIWGNDFGIYYYLSNSYLNIHSWIYPPSSPWGIDGYQYFPVTYIIADMAKVLTGSPLLISMKFSIPTVGGLTPFLLYLISREIGLNRNISFVAALLLAIDPVQTFQTSQANYLTVGHFFLLLSVLLFVKYHNNPKYFLPLLISLAALTLSHQLSAYVFVISAIGIVVSVHLYNGAWKSYLERDLFVITLSGASLLGYLILRVPTSRYFLVSAASGLGLPWIVLSFFVVVAVVFVVLKSQRTCCSLQRSMLKFRNRRELKREFPNILFLVIGTSIVEAALALIVVTGTYPFLNFTSLALAVPFAIFFALGVIGMKDALINGKYSVWVGWSAAIVISIIYSVASSNRTLEASRLFEYLTEPFSILAGVAILEGFKEHLSSNMTNKKRVSNTGDVASAREDLENKTLRVGRMKSNPRGERNKVMVAVALLSISLVATSYSMPSIFVPSASEGALEVDEKAIAYLCETGNRNFTVATDHQLGLLLFSYGFKAPFDQISALWTSDNWTKAIWELDGENGSFPRIGYILLDSSMLANGVWGFNGINNPMQPPIHLNNYSFRKFFLQPFRLVYKAGDPATGNAVYLFAVNITYVNNYYDDLSRNE
ncbi:MAG: hypothetical protein ACP5UZ_04170 [Thermoplasmata archaeon]